MTKQSTKRPQNQCYSCGYSWYPRGKDKSSRCPECGGHEIEDDEIIYLVNSLKHFSKDDVPELFTMFVVAPFLGFFGTLYLVYLAATGIASLGAQ